MNFYKTTLKNLNFEQLFSQLVTANPRKSARESQFVTINGRREQVTIIQAYNHPYGSFDSWYTESVAISLDILRRNGVTCDEYEL